RIAVAIRILESRGHGFEHGIGRTVWILVERELGQRVVILERAECSTQSRRPARRFSQQLTRGPERQITDRRSHAPHEASTTYVLVREHALIPHSGDFANEVMAEPSGPAFCIR